MNVIILILGLLCLCVPVYGQEYFGVIIGDTKSNVINVLDKQYASIKQNCIIFHVNDNYISSKYYPKHHNFENSDIEDRRICNYSDDFLRDNVVRYDGNPTLKTATSSLYYFHNNRLIGIEIRYVDQNKGSEKEFISHLQEKAEALFTLLSMKYGTNDWYSVTEGRVKSDKYDPKLGFSKVIKQTNTIACVDASYMFLANKKIDNIMIRYGVYSNLGEVSNSGIAIAEAESLIWIQIYDIILRNDANTDFTIIKHRNKIIAITNEYGTL